VTDATRNDLSAVLGRLTERLDAMTPAEMTATAHELAFAVREAIERKTDTVRALGNPEALKGWLNVLAGHAVAIIGITDPIQMAVVRETITVPNNSRI
jgi:hypothetical protein